MTQKKKQNPRRLLEQAPEAFALQDAARRKLGMSWSAWARGVLEKEADRVLAELQIVGLKFFPLLSIESKIVLKGAQGERPALVRHHLQDGSMIATFGETIASNEAVKLPCDEWEVWA